MTILMMSELEGNLIIIGISGVTCGGKTTTATQLNNIFPNSKIFSQDDYFLDVEDPRHVWIPELNHINFDILTSLDMEKMHDDILKFIGDNNLKRVNHVDKFGFESNGMVQKDIKKIFP
ncbi:hypothetical protein NQ314_001892 [Rhamnusium bicolor]|uniref:Phosphoribulokinase/uridine kinase domain-containing protein n=1 Tax=Rhamnusium bicolor TaxID=1586634 RepID=A0AAV8ZR81_9CUCU|nr:hypothetical protein NQ314_001892 [Rhamnusium bicolor]